MIKRRRSREAFRRMAGTAIGLAVCAMLTQGCADWVPDVVQSAGGPSVNEQSVQAVRELTAALASIEEHYVTGGDFIGNDPWMVAVVGALLILSPYVFGKSLWLLMGRLARLVSPPKTYAAVGPAAR